MIIRPSPAKSPNMGAKLFLRISFIVSKLNAISNLNELKDKFKVLRNNSSLYLQKNSNISLELYSKSL
ncbi:hypothetical protein DSECCO2_225350 [anaerobic digester metagenome]|jgi:hypothetical protein